VRPQRRMAVLWNGSEGRRRCCVCCILRPVCSVSKTGDCGTILWRQCDRRLKKGPLRFKTPCPQTRRSPQTRRAMYGMAIFLPRLR
jgi:hypothetical protein